VFFGALPMIFAGLRIALAVSFIVLVAAEFVATKSGVGYLIWNSWELLQVDTMFVGIVTIGFLGLLSSALFQSSGRLFRGRWSNFTTLSWLLSDPPIY
jgi:ABC-type nitrate/sulfonate/bicarbonate transport system permease component